MRGSASDSGALEAMVDCSLNYMMGNQSSLIRRADAMLLSALPKDVLRVILKKLSLKDRLRLEMVSKSHRDTLRQRELWLEIDLSAMQASKITENQLLFLLGRVAPLMQQIKPQIESMAEYFVLLSQEAMKQAPTPPVERLDELTKDLTYVGIDSLSVAMRNLSTLHDLLLPESWYKVRSLGQNLTICCSEVGISISRHLQNGTLRFRQLLSELAANPVRFIKGLLRRPPTLLGPDQVSLGGSGKAAVDLNFSGAASLSPHFLAACVVALSAAGLDVNFKMNGERDPSFSVHDLLGLLQSLAVRCSLEVKMLVSRLYPWKAVSLKDFNPGSPHRPQATGDGMLYCLMSLPGNTLGLESGVFDKV